LRLISTRKARARRGEGAGSDDVVTVAIISDSGTVVVAVEQLGVEDVAEGEI